MNTLETYIVIGHYRFEFNLPRCRSSPRFTFSHFLSSHSDHRSDDNNSIHYNNKPHSCQGHPLASNRERSCTGSRNPDKLSWAYEDFSLANPLHSHKSYLTAKGNLTTNWKTVINSSATQNPTQIPMIHSDFLQVWGFDQASLNV